MSEGEEVLQKSATTELLDSAGKNVKYELYCSFYEQYSSQYSSNDLSKIKEIINK